MKTYFKSNIVFWGTLAVLMIAVGSVSALDPNQKPPQRILGNNNNGPILTPLPVTVDQITHDNGNIVTTLDNWGYIGGYQFYDFPSGEWPRNSGHDYIGEIRYWMGAIDGTDTLVANSYDDFQGLPSLISSVPSHTILLSTDSTRYYNYDLTDTTGFGNGNPAFGWKVWNADSADWVYTNNYNPLTTSFFPGGPISVQESHYRFNDAASGQSLMGLELTQTVLQWNYCYNEDFLFVILEINNTSAVNYTDFAFGLYVDLDVGGPDGTGENGRLGDLVAYDSAANLAWTYDEDGYDEGWDSNTGIMGTKYLETPDDIGMTGFRTGLWALVPDVDPGRYEYIDSVGFDPILPPDDHFYIQCTRGISLEAGKTVRVVYALVAGADSLDFRNNADLAQNLYDNFFVGPEPPNTPTLTARTGDRKVYLRWNDTAEVSIDPLSGESDFAGYKLYRSENRGLTWGEVDTTNQNSCLGTDFERIAEFSVNSAGDPISHSFIDTGLYNDVEYWYALVAIDSGASATGVEPLQTGFGIAGQSPNIVKVTPRTDPAGYYDNTANTVIHNYLGMELPSEGSIIPIVFDPSVITTSDYTVTFEDSPQVTVWHLINQTTGDTVLANQTKFTGDPGEYEIVEGLQVVVREGDHFPRSMTQTTFSGPITTVEVGVFVGAFNEWAFAQHFGNKALRSTFELRFNGNTTVASAINDTLGLGMNWILPFEIWNVSTNEQVAAVVYDLGLDGSWQPWDYITIVDYPYSATVDPFTTAAFPYSFSWFFQFAPTYNPSNGDVFTFEGAPLNGPDDQFEFSTSGIDPSQATADLDKIVVVPNPYLVRSSAMTEFAAGETVITFRNIPTECTIRIYTLAGDLIKTLNHDDIHGTAEWDLLSESGAQIASGVYLFHVESPYGEHLGRFAVVK